MSTHALETASGQLDRLRLRLRVARQRTKLDAALASGVDPNGDPPLVLRASQLTSLSTRRALANTIGHLLDAAEEPPGSFGRVGSRPPLRRDAVLASKDKLLAVAAAFREPHYVPPQAAALASQLVWDSASPMYAAGPGSTVAELVDRILDLLRH